MCAPKPTVNCLKEQKKIEWVWMEKSLFFMCAPREKQAIFFWNPASLGLLICSHTLNGSYNRGGGLGFFFFHWNKWENMLKCSKWVKSFIENDTSSTGLMSNMKLVTERSCPGEEKGCAKAHRLMHRQTLQLQLSTLLPSFSCYPVVTSERKYSVRKELFLSAKQKTLLSCMASFTTQPSPH